MDAELQSVLVAVQWRNRVLLCGPPARLIVVCASQRSLLGSSPSAPTGIYSRFKNNWHYR